MLSVALSKNPTLKQRYWEEVCRKEQKAHIFNPKLLETMHERATPKSTMQSSYEKGIVRAFNEATGSSLSEAGMRASALGRSARSNLCTPRRFDPLHQQALSSQEPARKPMVPQISRGTSSSCSQQSSCSSARSAYRGFARLLPDPSELRPAGV
mmetsp:Transcript_40072/g.87511  ORF Transcript_40072/g.87511 Transcript_40072/m.87511 type:complete len:154 (-) Transcript_40072:94-555(-)